MARESKYIEMIEHLFNGNSIVIEGEAVDEFSYAGIRAAYQRELAKLKPEFRPEKHRLCVTTHTDASGNQRIRLDLVAPQRKLCYTVIPDSSGLGSHDSPTSSAMDDPEGKV